MPDEDPPAPAAITITDADPQDPGTVYTPPGSEPPTPKVPRGDDGELFYSPPEAVAASLTLGTVNSAVTYTDRNTGPEGNELTVAHQLGDSTRILVVAGGVEDWVNLPPPKLTITGTLTADGSAPQVFDELTRLTIPAGYMPPPVWPYFNAVNTDDATQSCSWTGEAWILADSVSGAEWTSTSTETRPDLVPSGAWNAETNADGWKPTAPATGTPEVTYALQRTATQAAAAVNAAEMAVTAVAGGFGNGDIIEAEATALSGGTGFPAPAVITRPPAN